MIFQAKVFLITAKELYFCGEQFSKEMRKKCPDVLSGTQRWCLMKEIKSWTTIKQTHLRLCYFFSAIYTKNMYRKKYGKEV